LFAKKILICFKNHFPAFCKGINISPGNGAGKKLSLKELSMSLTITIDGRDVTGEKGQTMLEIALENGLIKKISIRKG